MEVTNNTNTELLRRLGKSSEGPYLYEMYDKGTNRYKKYIVPEQSADKFEKLTNELLKSFDGMTDKKFVRNSMILGLLGAVGGVGLSLILTRKSSAFKKVLGMTGSAVLFGLGVTAVYMLNIMSKLYGYDKQIKTLNVRLYNEATEKDISFTGRTLIKPASEEEMKELIKLFVQTVENNIHNPNSKLPKWVQKIGNFICTKMFSSVMKYPNVLNLIARTEGKISGGYSMTLMSNNMAHLNFITLTPDKIGTKSGLEILRSLGQNICDCAKLNDVKAITFTTNSKNKKINNLLLKRIEPLEIQDIGLSETEYAIIVKDLEEKLAKV